MRPFAQNIDAKNLNYLPPRGRKTVGAVYGFAATTALRTPSRIHHIFGYLSAR